MESKKSQAENNEAKGVCPVSRFLSDDHARLDVLLQCAVATRGEIDHAAYAAFRAGLLKHIGMEEKILLPTAQRARGGEPFPVAAKLRLDHGALAALLVPTPTRAIISAIRTILTAHNPLEEGQGGVYEACEQLAGTEGEKLLARLRATPDVPLHRHVDGPRIMEATHRALMRAGFDLNITN